MSFVRSALLAVLFGFSLVQGPIANSQQDSQDNQPHIRSQRDSSSKTKTPPKSDVPVPDHTAASPQDKPAGPVPAMQDTGDSSSNDSQINLDAAPREPEPAPPANDSGDKELVPFDPHLAAKDIEVGYYNLRLKNYRSALDRFNHALLYKPGDAEATYGLAYTEEKLDLLSPAQKNYQAYLKMLPDGPRAKDAQEGLKRIGPRLEVKEDSGDKSESKLAEHDISVAETYLSMNSFAAARERLEEAVRLDPQNARACFRLAQSLQGLREIEPARLYYEKYLELDPKGPFAATAKKAIAAINDFMK